MRLTSAQVEDLLREIIAEDPEYQTELIQDQLKEHKKSNPKLHERLTEKAWDFVFVDTGIVTFDEMEPDLRSEPGPIVQMPFRYVKDQVFEYIDNGGNIREYLLRKLNIVFRHLGLTSEFMEAIDSPDSPWQNALNAFWVLILLLEQDPKGEQEQAPLSKEAAALFLLCEEIPTDARPSNGKKRRTGIKGPLETGVTVDWVKLDRELCKGEDKKGTGLNREFHKLQTAYDIDDKKTLKKYIDKHGMILELVLSEKGKEKLKAIRNLTC